jgi:hypothetical protein
MVQLHLVEAIEKIFQALVEIQRVRALATEAMSLPFLHGDVCGVSIGPPWIVVDSSPLMDFPEAEDKSSNFLQTPFFKLELFALLANDPSEFQNCRSDSLDVGAVHRQNLYLLRIRRHVQIELLRAS